MSEYYPYPEREHYEFPSNPVEQAYEELNYYPTPGELRQNLAGLFRLYKEEPFLVAMQRYASMAATLQPEQVAEFKNKEFNFDFYSGALLATHLNVAATHPIVKEELLGYEPLIDLQGHPIEQQYNEHITSNLAEWANSVDPSWYTSYLGQDEGFKLLDWDSSEAPSWYDTFVSQDEEYQMLAMELADLLYQGREEEAERQYDFIIGFTFVSGLINQILPPLDN